MSFPLPFYGPILLVFTCLRVSIGTQFQKSHFLYLILIDDLFEKVNRFNFLYMYSVGKKTFRMPRKGLVSLTLLDQVQIIPIIFEVNQIPYYNFFRVSFDPFDFHNIIKPNLAD